MITKKEFVAIINRLEQAEKLLELLEEVFDEKDSNTLRWWIFTEKCGKNFKLGDFKVDDEVIDISTSEKLYDYLIKGCNK